jgi:putative flippase GtrA
MKIIRYFFVGGAAAAVDFSLFAILTKLTGVPWFLAALISFVAATVLNYVLSVRHVFTSGVRFSRDHEIALVFIVSAIGLSVNQLVLWLLIERGGWEPLIAKVCGTGAVFLWNFGARYRFIFRGAR